MPRPKLYSTVDVAKMLDLSVPTVTYWARELEVGQIVGTSYVFTDEDVDAIRNRPGARQAYRPRKQKNTEIV